MVVSGEDFALREANRQGGSGRVWSVPLFGKARQARSVKADSVTSRTGEIRHGKAGRARTGISRQIAVRRGAARQACLVRESRVKDRLGKS